MKGIAILMITNVSLTFRNLWIPNLQFRNHQLLEFCLLIHYLKTKQNPSLILLMTQMLTKLKKLLPKRQRRLQKKQQKNLLKGQRNKILNIKKMKKRLTKFTRKTKNQLISPQQRRLNQLRAMKKNLALMTRKKSQLNQMIKTLVEIRQIKTQNKVTLQKTKRINLILQKIRRVIKQLILQKIVKIQEIKQIKLIQTKKNLLRSKKRKRKEKRPQLKGFHILQKKKLKLLRKYLPNQKLQLKSQMFLKIKMEKLRNHLLNPKLKSLLERRRLMRKELEP